MLLPFAGVPPGTEYCGTASAGPFTLGRMLRPRFAAFYNEAIAFCLKPEGRAARRSLAITLATCSPRQTARRGVSHRLRVFRR
jgi:hypothetical protein